MHLIWANHDSCEENEVSQISRDVQIGCLTFPTSFIAMLVHRGAEPFGVVQLGNSSQFPQGSLSEAPAEPHSSTRSRFQAASRR